MPGVDCLVNGSGRPVTVFLPGLGGAISHLRPLGGGVPGTRIFCELAGDDAAEDFAGLSAALRTVADRFDADRVLGVSLGAGAVLRLLSETPDRFARAVIFQPSVLCEVAAPRRAKTTSFLELASSGDLEALATRLDQEVPAGVRDVRQSREASVVRAERLARPEGLRLLKNLADGDPPVYDPELLRAVTAEVLVVAAQDDPVHPVSVAQEIAELIPRARLTVFPTPAPLFDSRAELRGLLSGFLAG